MSDYLSDIYKQLHKVTSIKRMVSGTEKSISKIYKGSEQIWPKGSTPVVDPPVVGCVCWRDLYPPKSTQCQIDVTENGYDSEGAEVASERGIKAISASAPWNDQTGLRDVVEEVICVPKSSSLAYLLDQYFNEDTGPVSDPETGMRYNMYAEDNGDTDHNCHSVLGYFWRVYLNPGETFRIFGQYDDTMYVRRNEGDGSTPVQVYFHDANGFSSHDYSFTTPSDGSATWYEFQLFLGNHGGLAGPAGGSIASPSGYGVRYAIITSDSVVHGPFKIGYNKDSVLGVRFALPSDWRE